MSPRLEFGTCSPRVMPMARTGEWRVTPPKRSLSGAGLELI